MRLCRAIFVVLHVVCSCGIDSQSCGKSLGNSGANDALRAGMADFAEGMKNIVAENQEGAYFRPIFKTAHRSLDQQNNLSCLYVSYLTPPDFILCLDWETFLRAFDLVFIQF